MARLLKDDFAIPVSVVSDGSVRHARSDPSERSDKSKDLASQVTCRESGVEGIVYEDGRLQHHEEVAKRQVYDEQVRRCPQRFGSVCKDIEERKGVKCDVNPCEQSSG